MYGTVFTIEYRTSITIAHNNISKIPQGICIACPWQPSSCQVSSMLLGHVARVSLSLGYAYDLDVAVNMYMFCLKEALLKSAFPVGHSDVSVFLCCIAEVLADLQVFSKTQVK